VLLAVAAGAYADAALERELGRSSTPASPAAGALSPVDRGLATELAYGAIRQRRLLDAWIDAHGRVPAARQPPKLRWLLHLGLYQLLFSERVPASAAVSTTVELAKRGGLARLAPVVNGLLRAVLRSREDAEGEPWRGLPLPPDPAAAFAVRHSLPDWLAAELLQWLPPGMAPARAEAFGRACNTPPPLDLRVNPLRTSRDALLAALAASGHPAVPLVGIPQGLTLLERPGDLRGLPGYREGHWCVQDRTAQRISPLLEPLPGALVLDACAAPGGKSTHLAELMGDRGEVWAVDRSEARLRRVAANAERLGLTTIRTLAADAGDLLTHQPGWRGRFDRILLDAPCSGLGTLARHADARWRIDPAAIEELVALQGRLMEGLAPLLAPGGRLVYATCTVHPRENGEVIDAFLATGPQLARVLEQQWWPGESAAEGDASGGGDGFFAAVLKN
jgi:16S rRNA (cytosine967-C5)-methyltransferase